MKNPVKLGIMLTLLLIWALIVWPAVLVILQLRFKLPDDTVAEMLHYGIAILSGPVVAYVIASHNLTKGGPTDAQDGS